MTTWGQFDEEVKWDDPVTWDHDWILWDGIPVDHGVPFIVETGPTKFMSNAALAAALGVR